jgi:hypothetical protein
VLNPVSFALITYSTLSTLVSPLIGLSSKHQNPQESFQNIVPKLRLLWYIAWTYCVPQLPSHNCACCACYGGLLCCCIPDGRTRIDPIYVEAYTCVEHGGLFEPLKSHHCASFVNNFVWPYILFDCVVLYYIVIFIAKWP